MCYFLELPAELRNNILELATTNDEENTEIVRTTNPPAWTAACRQVRKEALPLWMISNSFSICVKSDADVKRVVAFEQMCLKHIYTEKMDVTITFEKRMTASTRPSTGIMEFWQRHLHGDGYWLPRREDNVNMFSLLMIASLELAFRCHELDWDEVESMISTCYWGISEAVRLFGRFELSS